MASVVVVVVDGGVDAAVVGPPFVEEVWVRFGWVAHASSLSSGSSVEPALVAVAAGGVAGQRVAAGVAGVLSLALQRTRGRRLDTLREEEKKKRRTNDDESDLRVSVRRVFPRDILSG